MNYTAVGRTLSILGLILLKIAEWQPFCISIITYCIQTIRHVVTKFYDMFSRFGTMQRV